MNILITGDWHYRKKKPRNRLDNNYQESINIKIKKIFDAARYHGCKYILQPGDMFDDADVSDSTKREFLQLMSTAPCPILTVPGQHDLRNHSKVWQNTPMGIMDAGDNNVIVVNQPLKFDDFSVYNSGWGEKIPDPNPEDKFSILLCHKLIIKKNVPYAYDYAADEILRKYPYDLIVSGDNHQHFIETDSHKMLVNCGSLMRTRIDQSDHTPCAYIYGMKEGALITQIILDVPPFRDIMDVEKAEEEAEKNENLKSFIKKVKETKTDEHNEEFNFKKRLASRITHGAETMGDGPTNVLKEVMDNARWE